MKMYDKGNRILKKHREKKERKEGQLFAMDLMLSLLVFFIVFIMLISLLNRYSIRITKNIQSEEQHLTAYQITDLLLKSKGIPETWEEDPANVVLPGLKKSYGVIDEDKLTGFTGLDYGITKELFKIEHFEYYFEVLDQAGSPLVPPVLIGLKPDASSQQTISIMRFVLVQSGTETDTRQIRLTLWRPS